MRHLHSVGPGRLAELRECKHVHDAVWLASLLAVTVGIVIASRLQFIEAPAGAIVGVLLGYLALYALGSEALARMRRPESAALALRAMQLVGVLYLGLVWLLSGGPRAPGLLLVFSLPVAASGLLRLRGQAYLSAGVSIAVVAGVALGTWPEIRSQLGVEWLELSRSPSMVPARLTQLVVVFGVVQSGLAVITEGFFAIARNLDTRLDASLRAFDNIRALFQTVLRATPVPEVLVHSDTHRVIHASDAFWSRHGSEPHAEAGLFDIVAFEAEEEIRAAVKGRRPLALLTTFVLGGQRRVGNVEVFPLHYEGDDYAHVSLRDETDVYLRMAVEAFDAAVVVVDPEDRIAYLNPRAAELFEGVRRGGSVGSILVSLGLPRAYLKLVNDVRVQTSAELYGVEYVVSTSIIVRPALGRLSLLSIRSAARGGTAEIVNPFAVYYAPRFFTEAASRFLAGPEPSGTLALLELSFTNGASEDPGLLATFVSLLDGLLGTEDLLLGVRPGRFSLLAPERSVAEVTQILERVRGMARSGAPGTRLPVEMQSSVVPISSGSDLDSLMRSAEAGLVGRAAGAMS